MPRVRKAIIPVAGLGTRQYPASSVVPKSLFPLVDRDGLTKPLIQIIAEEALEAGAEEVCIIVQPGQRQLLSDYFRGAGSEQIKALAGKDWAALEAEKLADIGRRLHLVEQDRPLGFGHAVCQARDFAGGEPCLIMLGDHVFISETKDRCARQAVDAFEQLGGEALSAVQLTGEPQLHLFGTIRGEPIDPARGIYRAGRIIEKPGIDEARRELVTPGLPAGTYLSHFGIHIFSAAIFDALRQLIDAGPSGEVQLTAAQELLRQQRGGYHAATIRGQRYDTGIPSGLLEAQLALGMNGVHRTEICESLLRVMAERMKL